VRESTDGGSRTHAFCGERASRLAGSVANVTSTGSSLMELVIFAILGGSMGWGSSRMAGGADGRLAVGTSILTGISGAVIAGWLLIPLLGGGARNDFTVTGPVVSLGAVVTLAVAAFLRQFGRR
jgi:uncharacterized membrane protein YeaQ/YmgE (transglycosylase-associated protein family)